MKKNRLTPDQKAKIIEYYGKYENKFTYIGSLLNLSESTVRSFIDRYKKSGHFQEKLGRPTKIKEEQKNVVVRTFENNPETTLREAKKYIDMSIYSMVKALHENDIKYFQKIAVPNLTLQHKQKRVEFSTMMNDVLPNTSLNIIITDESTVEVDSLRGGIWRRRGHYPPGSFQTKDPHPVHVMVWGGIGPDGYKTKLLKVNGRLNSIKYIQLLTENEIFTKLNAKFHNNYIFQQDNAPCHVSKYSVSLLSDCVPTLLDWPAKSPDLSPIEQVWNYLKWKMVGLTFKDPDSLFERLSQEWNAIPPVMIKSFYDSFRARCTVCARINGESLNGHWKEVRKEHDLYRNQIE